MIVRNRIWVELKQAKANIICLQRYTDRGRRRLRSYSTLLILLPTISAVVGGATNCLLITVVGASITAIVAALKSLLPHLIQTDQELSELDRLMDFYSKYMNKLERIWYELYNDFIPEKEAIGRLFIMKEEEADKYSTLNRGIRSISKKEQDEIDKRAAEYIDEVYFKKTKDSEETVE